MKFTCPGRGHPNQTTSGAGGGKSGAALLRPEVWPSRLGTGAHELPKSLLAGTDQNRQRDGKRLNGEDRATGQGSRGHGGQSVGGVTRWMGPAFRGLEVSARPLCPAFPAKALGMWPEPGSSSIKHLFWGTHVAGLGPAPGLFCPTHVPSQLLHRGGGVRWLRARGRGCAGVADAAAEHWPGSQTAHVQRCKEGPGRL